MSWAADFVHLHVASAYSLRYGVASPAALVARAAQHGMRALALTDRDGLYGAVKHAVACAEAGISTILGADLALVGPAGDPAGRVLNSAAPARLRSEDAARVTLLASGRRGWASLCRLVSAAHQAGPRGAPVITPGLVAEYAEGLIILLGPGSDVGRAIAARRPDHAAAALARWREHGEVVIEITDHRTRGSTHRAARMLRLAREAGVTAVLTNAVRYLDPPDAAVAQVLDAARQLAPLSERHLARRNARAYLASGDDMAAIAARVCGVPEDSTMTQLLHATAVLAERCTLDPQRDLGLGGRFMPETTGGAPLVTLRMRCAEGLRRRYPGGIRARGQRRVRRRAAQRLDHELSIIAKTGLASYFLTVADVASLIRSRGIRCSIRGSGAGCLVNYLIGISNIDPLDYDLIMERFLSESRKGLPDIDLDVESARRIEAYRAIVDAYSDQRVACVSMMETYRARSAIRDVAASLGLPPHEIDAVAKAFPHIRAGRIRNALTELPELRTSGLAMPQLTAVFQLAERLDGLPRHVAMHPCGVVLSDTSLLDRTPVERSFEGLPLSQFDKDDVETAGMIKLDVLGVRMQSAMAYTLTEIDRTRGEQVDIDTVGCADEPTFEMIRSARTLGCFQIESPGQRELVAKLLPRTMGDLIVDISLFRPGPVNSDMVTPYLETRHGRQEPSYPHEDLAATLSETGGVVIFHEQVLRIIHAMTGCGLSEAERIRRMLSDDRSRASAGEWFREAARDRGYNAATVVDVWEVLESFGGFGFCKAHAAAFAVPTYQSAWLKRHYPAAFYAGVLTHDPGMYPKRVIVGDARLAGIPILPVDVNASAGDWCVERVPQLPGEGLRPGLREVKGISEAEVARIVAGQPYTSLRDLWERAAVSRPVAERLVLVGALDSLYDPDEPDAGAGEPDAGAGEPGAGAAEPGVAGESSVARKSDVVNELGVTERSRGAEKPGVAGEFGVAEKPGVAGRPPSRRDLLARVGVLDRRTRPSRPGPGPSSRLFTHSVPANPHKRDTKAHHPREEWEAGAPAAGGPAAGEGRAVAGEPAAGEGDARAGGPAGRGGLVGGMVAGGSQALLDLDADRDGFAELVPAGELRELTPAERVETELEILGIDLSRHVVSFYEDLLAQLGVVRSADLHRCRAGSRILVAGVKIATQTPAIRSGMRIIFATLDDATGPVDLAFFESVQPRCAARVFGSWLLVVRGRVRRTGGSVSVNGEECWDLAALEEIRAASGIGAVRAAMAAGDVPAQGGPAQGGRLSRPVPEAGEKIIYPNGFVLSPYAETGSPGPGLKGPPRKLWHASPGSSGGLDAGIGNSD
ncbi:MAG TPA: DNA polymerase III subunit alpha [Streptosporangiaceae bacterium]|nr:DNA polymerase III subunit alpha [Streptosporangiaceae bacterium]